MNRSEKTVNGSAVLNSAVVGLQLLQLKDAVLDSRTTLSPPVNVTLTIKQVIML